jgi:hypothetical protein
MENEELFDEEIFSNVVYQSLAPVVKTFLSTYFGEKLLHLEPEMYSEIETIIKKNINTGADILPDDLFNHCTIKDSDEWERAYANFKPDDRPIPWHDTENWFDTDFIEEQEEYSFIEDVNDFELNEAQRKAKECIKSADEVINGAQNFAHFMRTGYKVLNEATRQIMIDTSIFDLKHLTDEGFIVLQKHMNMMNEMLLEDLSVLLEE